MEGNSSWASRGPLGEESTNPHLNIVSTRRTSPFSYAGTDTRQCLDEEAWLSSLSSRTSTESDDNYVPPVRKRKKAGLKAKGSKMKSKNKNKKPQRTATRKLPRSQKREKRKRIAEFTPTPPVASPSAPFLTPNGVCVRASDDLDHESAARPSSELSFKLELEVEDLSQWPTYSNVMPPEARTTSPNYPPEHPLLASMRKPPSLQEFRAEILDSVSRMRFICSELVSKAPLISQIDTLGTQIEQLPFRKAAERELERLILTLEGPICDFRNLLKSAFFPFFNEIPAEEKWVRAVLRGTKEKVRADYGVVLKDIKKWVDRIVLTDACLAISYYEGLEGGRLEEEMRPFCVKLLESAYDSIHTIKKLSIELEFAIMNELWTIK